MTTYQNALAEFLALDGNTQVKLAQDIQISQAAINRYVNGVRWPNREVAELIDAATEGKVPLSLWRQEAARRLGIEPPAEQAA